MSYFVLKDNFKKIAGVRSVLLKGTEKAENKPLVSIAIPTYKRPYLLKTALDSVLGQKNFDDYEVVIVDNDTQSGNETELLLRSYTDKRIRYYRNLKNIGMVNNWNRAIDLCRGEWITILHDDDALYPNFLSAMYSAICNCNPELLSCNCRFGEELVAPLKDNAKTFRVHEIKMSKCLMTDISPFPGILFKKGFAKALGGFNDEFFPVSDYVFWTIYCMRYKGFMVDGTLAFYRTGAVSTSSKVYIDIINGSHAFKKELGQKINLPAIYKKLLQDVGMRVLIGGYLKYDTENHMAREINYAAPGIKSPLVRKVYGAAFKGLNQITKVL